MRRNEHFLGIADMMSGLMMVFLFIAVVFMLYMQCAKNVAVEQKNAMAKIAEMAERSRAQLHKELVHEFGEAERKAWNAEILNDNTVRFNSPEVLFKRGKNVIRRKFKLILDDFFPRYVDILYTYRDEIKAIRIEGHTSSEWLGANTVRERYLRRGKIIRHFGRDTQEIATSVPKLLDGLKLAFITSILGMFLSVAVMVLETLLVVVKPSRFVQGEEDVIVAKLNELQRVLEEQHKALLLCLDTLFSFRRDQRNAGLDAQQTATRMTT